MKCWEEVPKVELHLHLEGSVRFQTLLQEYRRHGLELPSDNEQTLREFLLTARPEGSLHSFLEKFSRTQVIFRDEVTIERVARECVLDRFSHGVKLMEIRYSPAFIALGHSHLCWDSIHQAVMAGVANAVAVIGADCVEVGLICIAVGAMGDELFAQTVEFAIKHKRDFVGFDIAGAEGNPRQYKTHMDKVHNAGLSITVHAAEDMHTGHPEHVVVAVKDLHARRIGHGIQIVRDEEALALVRDMDVLLEIAPYSNWITGGVDVLNNHPIRQLYEKGVKLSVSTDDPGIMDIDINEEYRMLHDEMSFTLADLRQFNLWGLEHSFLPDKAKRKIREKYFE
eukprot:GHVS01011839.1.p1 GENE.GHVS01011839.1~~GHVS01011839.1.p1  ORF type:complete len:339 (-),score=44.84 GHVS01011839.1:51-1067(-)